jgi:acyl-CoA thioesterase YciA
MSDTRSVGPVKTGAEAIPVIRTIAKTADTNPAGDIFGGWLMTQMDLAAGWRERRLIPGVSGGMSD